MVVSEKEISTQGGVFLLSNVCEVVDLEERTLCKKCAQNYREAGFLLKVKRMQVILEPCDICKRGGYEYEIMKKIGRASCRERVSIKV